MLDLSDFSRDLLVLLPILIGNAQHAFTEIYYKTENKLCTKKFDLGGSPGRKRIYDEKKVKFTERINALYNINPSISDSNYNFFSIYSFFTNIYKQEEVLRVNKTYTAINYKPYYKQGFLEFYSITKKPQLNPKNTIFLNSGFKIYCYRNILNKNTRQSIAKIFESSKECSELTTWIEKWYSMKLVTLANQKMLGNDLSIMQFSLKALKYFHPIQYQCLLMLILQYHNIPARLQIKNRRATVFLPCVNKYSSGRVEWHNVNTLFPASENKVVLEINLPLQFKQFMSNSSNSRSA